MATCVNSATTTNLIPFKPVRDEADRNNSQPRLVQRAQRGNDQAFRNVVGIESLSTSVDPETLLAKAGVLKRVVHLKKKEAAYSQGDAASAVFYIQKGKVQLTVVSKVGKEVTLGILEKGEFFGEGCLVPQSLRVESATAMTDCELLRIDKKEMMLALQREHAFSELFVASLVARNTRYQGDLIDHLFNSGEKRLARILLLLAHFGEEGVHETVIPMITQETLAEMVGTTRSRTSYFMNRFRKLGYLEYRGGSGIQVHPSLFNVVRDD